MLVARPEAARAGRGLAHSTAALIRENLAFVALLAVGLTMRVLTMVAYPPALFFGDSWGYVVTAFSGHPFAISNIRPSGYPILMRLLTLPDRSIVQLVALQHLAGLAVAVLVYALLVRAGLRRWLATVAAALVVLDGYTMTLEQYVMAEPFFTLTVIVAALLLVWHAIKGGTAARRPGAATVAIAAALIAASTIERTAGVFVIPVFLVYLLCARVGWRRCAIFLVTLALPILAYCAAVDAKFGTFGITQDDGWLLYGRVAGFAHCAGADVAGAARPLCETAAQRATHPTAPTWYEFSHRSPAVRAFGLPTNKRSNALVGGFARDIILHQPLDYVGAVAADFGRFFTPGATQFNDAVSATSLPTSASGETIIPDVRDRFLQGTHPRVQSPARIVRAYRSVVHVPRPLLALLALASLIGLLVRTARWREILLFSGSGLALLLGAAATAGFGVRYEVPAVPLIVVGGTIAGWELWRRSANGPR